MDLLLTARSVVARSATEIRSQSNDSRSARCWHVLHTRSRQEKAVARVLDAAGVETFLPLVKRTVRYGHRKRHQSTPLFSGYLFLLGSVEDTYVATQTRRVAKVIAVTDQESVDAELAQIRRALESGADLTPLERLVPGRRVRVSSGAFAGLEGLVERRGRADRIVLQIDAIGRAACLEMDADLLEPVD